MCIHAKRTMACNVWSMLLQEISWPQGDDLPNPFGSLLLGGDANNSRAALTQPARLPILDLRQLSEVGEHPAGATARCTVAVVTG